MSGYGRDCFNKISGDLILREVRKHQVGKAELSGVQPFGVSGPHINTQTKTDEQKKGFK